MAFSIMVGLSKPPLREPNLISVREGAIKARAAAVVYAERTRPEWVRTLPTVEEIEKTVDKAWAGPSRPPEDFPVAPQPEEFVNHQLAVYIYRVGRISVTVRASNGDILGGGIPISIPRPGIPAGSPAPMVSPEVMAAISGAPVVPAEPAPAPVAPASAPVASPSGMPVGLVAVAGGAFALILGVWAMWGRKR